MFELLDCVFPLRARAFKRANQLSPGTTFPSLEPRAESLIMFLHCLVRVEVLLSGECKVLAVLSVNAGVEH